MVRTAVFEGILNLEPADLEAHVKQAVEALLARKGLKNFEFFGWVVFLLQALILHSAPSIDNGPLVSQGRETSCQKGSETSTRHLIRSLL